MSSQWNFSSLPVSPCLLPLHPYPSGGLPALPPHVVTGFTDPKHADCHLLIFSLASHQSPRSCSLDISLGPTMLGPLDVLNRSLAHADAPPFLPSLSILPRQCSFHPHRLFGPCRPVYSSVASLLTLPWELM